MKYKLDVIYGMIEFFDDLLKVVIGYMIGVVIYIMIVFDFGVEYVLFFEGIDKISKDKVFLVLYCIIKLFDLSFGLIYEEFGLYEISGDVLGDLIKDKDGVFGLYGYYI